MERGGWRWLLVGHPERHLLVRMRNRTGGKPNWVFEPSGISLPDVPIGVTGHDLPLHFGLSSSHPTGHTMNGAVMGSIYPLLLTSPAPVRTLEQSNYLLHIIKHSCKGLLSPPHYAHAPVVAGRELAADARSRSGSMLRGAKALTTTRGHHKAVTLHTYLYQQRPSYIPVHTNHANELASCR